MSDPSHCRAMILLLTQRFPVNRSSAPSSPNSLESAPMDESDSDAEPARGGGGAAPPSGEDDEKYPVDGLYVSQAEKAEITAMRDLEREQILAERRDLVERQRQNRLLRQMVTNFENEERKQGKKKRSADTAELEDGQRKPTKQRTGKGSETAMDTLRRAKAEKQRRREDQERRRDAFSPRRDLRDDDESDDDFGRPRSRTPEPEPEREVPPAELRDYDRVRLGRNEFAQVCFTPGFEPSITGCYIRIALGPHPDTGVEQYRLALIKGTNGDYMTQLDADLFTGFTTSRPYALNGPNGSFVTDQYVRAAHGKAIKEFPFIAASSGKVTEVCTGHPACGTILTIPERAQPVHGYLPERWGHFTYQGIPFRKDRRNQQLDQPQVDERRYQSQAEPKERLEEALRPSRASASSPAA